MIKIKGNALRECSNHDATADNGQTRPIFVKVKVSQERIRQDCTTKALNLYDLEDLDYVIMGSNLSSCQDLSLDLKLPSIKIELQFSRTYRPGIVSVESL